MFTSSFTEPYWDLFKNGPKRSSRQSVRYLRHQQIHHFKVIDFKPKTFGDYDVEIKTNVCGVCSSDVHTITVGWGEPILPLISGHEIAGVLTKVGSKVTEFKAGDHAGVGAQVCACFECRSCKTDNEYLPLHN